MGLQSTQSGMGLSGLRLGANMGPFQNLGYNPAHGLRQIHETAAEGSRPSPAPIENRLRHRMLRSQEIERSLSVSIR